MQFMQPCIHILTGLKGMTNVSLTEELRSVLYDNKALPQTWMYYMLMNWTLMFMFDSSGLFISLKK